MKATLEGSFLSPLSIRSYWRFLVAHAVVWQVTTMEWVVTGWLVLDMTGSPWKVALVDFFRFMPWLIIGLLSGPIVKRFGRKRVVIASQFVYVTCTLSLAGLLSSGRLEYWHVVFIACVNTGTVALDFTARRSLLPKVVGRGRTLDAVLLETIVQSLNFTLGPFTGGGLAEWIGPVGCYVVIAALPLVNVGALWGVQMPAGDEAQARESVRRTVKLGFEYVRGNRTIFGVLLLTAVMNLLIFPYQSLLPVFAKDVLFQGPVGLGLLGGACGLGSFAGLVLVNLLRNRLNNNWLFAVCCAQQTSFLVLFALSGQFYLSLVVLTVSGIGYGGFNVLQSAIILVEASDQMRDRAMGALVCMIGTGPLGRLLIGAVASGWGAPVALGGACSIAVLLILAVAVALPEFRVLRSRAATGDTGH